MLRRTAWPLTAAIALTLLAAPAPGLAAAPPDAAPVQRALVVVPQVSVRGVRVGMSPTQVRKALGRRPDRSTRQAHPILGQTSTWTFGRLRVLFDGAGDARRVISVTTSSRSDRTARGVGVGSTEATVRARVPGVRCRTELGYRSCTVGTERPGQIVTVFSISTKRKVSRILLGRVID